MCVCCVFDVYSLSHLFIYFFSANAGMNKAASSSTSLNTRKLDEDTDNLTREYFWFIYCSRQFILFFQFFWIKIRKFNTIYL